MSLKQKMRIKIRGIHLAVDGVLGRIFTSKGALGKHRETPHQIIQPGDFFNFSYSKQQHFSKYRLLPIHKYQSSATCDLKVYQDSLVYTFILDNIPSGAKILEIGGGNSRIINQIKHNYEIWNLDKLEGTGYGPTKIINKYGFHLVKDYIGTYSSQLPNNYFDLIYSVSTIEHFSKDTNDIQNILEDMQRLLHPGGYSLHCVDALLYNDHFIVHPLVEKIQVNGLMDYSLPSFDKINNDVDLWTLPPYAFYTRWYHLVKTPLKKFGRPFSINLLWKKLQT